LANHKSAAKRARSSVRKNAVNTKTLSGVRKIEKKLRKSVTAKQKDESTKMLVQFESVIAKAAQKGRIHYRTASRKIGRLAKAVAKLA
jgi:small subunit ribosomal protein S20